MDTISPTITGKKIEARKKTEARKKATAGEKVEAGAEWVSVADAAVLLGVHRSTISFTSL